MRLSKAFTAFAASYFAIVFLKDGTLVGAFDDLTKGAKRVLKGSKRLTRIT